MKRNACPAVWLTLAVAIALPVASPADPVTADPVAADPVAVDAGSYPAGRLGPAVRPLRYRLDLTVLPEAARFTGAAAIEVNLAQPARTIHLHGNGLTVTSAVFVAPDGTEIPGSYEQVDPTGVARLRFDEEVPAGTGELRFVYSAPFNENGAGLYRSVVDEDAYAFTQFQPIDARRVFPGFDEPGFKTPFDIAVTTRADNVVVGNMPAVDEHQVGERGTGAGRKRVVFETTPPLPTYLIALAVGPLDVVQAPPVPPNAVRRRPLPLRGVATRGKGPQFRYALANTAGMVDYLEQYFGVAFPYPKLDLIASPDFGGGMENAGAIVYGDPRILIPDDAPFERRRDFGGIHAHELAHQWFGDFVTPRWWDDIWLNESFANWMSFKAGHAWQPALGFDVVPALQTPAAMAQDSRIAARRIRQPVARNGDIFSAFDGITYLKGGAVLGMFENWLGEARFRAGIRAHMRRFPHAVADVEDFMASLAEGSGRPDVVPAFRSFIDQAGVPLVTVALECDATGAVLELAQARYLPVGSRGNPAARWQVPFCVRYGTGQTEGAQCMLLSGDKAQMTLETPGCPDFVMPNADGAGYYRFALDDDGWWALTRYLGRLDEQEALAVADSLSAAYHAGRLQTDAFLAAVTRLAQSPWGQVAMAPDGDLVLLRDEIAPPDSRPAVTAFMRSLYRPRLDELAAADEQRGGTSAGAHTAGPDAGHVRRELFRTSLVRFLALEAEDAGLRSTLAAQANRYIGYGAPPAGPDVKPDPDAISPALVEVALQVGVQENGAGFVEALIARLLASADMRFRAQAAVALGATDDPETGDRVRALLLDPALRTREPTAIAFALAERPSQRRATFDWFTKNHEAFIGRISHFGYRWLPRFGAGFCTLAERDEVDRFFTPLLSQLDGAARTLAETLEGIELCAALADAKRDQVERYFAAPD